MGKVCRTCKKEKSTLKFHVNTKAPQGVAANCKDCISDIQRKRYRTDRLYFIKNRYAAMKQRAEGRSVYPCGSKGKPILSREEFLAWYETTKEEFDKLWEVYVADDYNTSLAPSVDRIDNDRGYEIENIRWITVHDNSVKRDNLATDNEDS